MELRHRNVFLIIARMNKGLSQENMAADLGISTKQYSNYENGVTKSIPKLYSQKISKILEIEEELISKHEGCFIISGNTITGTASGINNINNFNNELLQKENEGKEAQLKNKDEQLMLYKQEIEKLRIENEKLRKK